MYNEFNSECYKFLQRRTKYWFPRCSREFWKFQNSRFKLYLSCWKWNNSGITSVIEMKKKVHKIVADVLLPYICMSDFRDSNTIFMQVFSLSSIRFTKFNTNGIFRGVLNHGWLPFEFCNIWYLQWNCSKCICL